MEYASLGHSSISVSRLCLGTWQATDWSTSNKKDFFATIRRAVELGINFFDTAELYGNGVSESQLGQALQDKRKNLIIASKFSHKNSAPSDIRRSLEASLRRLKTDYIDLYQQHWPPHNPPLDDTVAELVKLRTEGKIRAIGVSNWMEPEFAECNLLSEIDCLQPCYSLLWRGIERSVLNICRSHSISIIPYSPLCQGMLAGKFLKISDVPDDFRKKNILLGSEYFEKSLAVYKVVAELGLKYNMPPASIALRFLLDSPGVTSPIVGASSAQQLEQSVLALDWKLSPDDYSNLSQASQEFVSAFPAHTSLWGWHPRSK